MKISVHLLRSPWVKIKLGFVRKVCIVARYVGCCLIITRHFLQITWKLQFIILGEITKKVLIFIVKSNLLNKKLIILQNYLGLQGLKEDCYKPTLISLIAEEEGINEEGWIFWKTWKEQQRLKRVEKSKKSIFEEGKVFAWRGAKS